MTKLTRGLTILGLAAALLGCGGAAKQGDTDTKTGAESQPSPSRARPSSAESQPSK